MANPTLNPSPPIIEARGAASDNRPMRFRCNFRLILPSALIALALLTAGCATVRRDVPVVPSTAWEHPADTTLGREYGRELAAYPGQSGLYVLDDGREAFLARAALAESAERTLDLQYYYISEDATGDILLLRLLRAAQRGVRVRLLLDDLYAARGNFDIATLAAHPRIEVRLFNPFETRGSMGLGRLLEFLGNTARLNQRMHNKLWIADNAVAIAGGRNLGDQYFEAQPERNFADLDLLIAGPVVRELSRSFDDFWNSGRAIPAEAFLAEAPDAQTLARFETTLNERLAAFRDTEYARAVRETALARYARAGHFPLIPAPAEAYSDRPRVAPDPAAREPAGLVQLKVRPLIESAQREVVLISPYFVPSDRGIDMLGELVKKGVRVRVLTNSLASTDVMAVHAGYSRQRGKLLARGVEIHEFKPARDGDDKAHRAGLIGSSHASLHAKAVIIDRANVIVGSMNLDPRSRSLNTEVAVFAQSGVLGNQLGALFDQAVEPAHAFRVELAEASDENAPLVWTTEDAGKPERYTSEPLTGFWRRAAAAVLGLFAPDDML